MLEIVGGAELSTLLLAALVQLALWALRIRHVNLALAAWTALLIASLAMPPWGRASSLRVAAPLRLCCAGRRKVVHWREDIG